MRHLPDVQLFLRDGLIEFGWGHPNPGLLPVEGLARATDDALRRDGPSVLAYGAEQGPGRLIDAICKHLDIVDGTPHAPETIFITGGISQGIDLLATLLTRPGDVVLVESPVYHLALRILRDHDLELVPVASDSAGLRVDALADAIEKVHKDGKRAPLLYTVPSFTNPTGATMTAERRAALMQVIDQHDITVLEDDVYRELWFETPPPPPLATFGDPKHVVRMCSFAKILAPGLRLGWLVADPVIVQRCVTCGMIDSGGGVNHFTAQVVAEYLHAGALEPHVADLRRAYRERRDILLGALHEYLPAKCSIAKPGGGFFIWIELPEGMDCTTLLPVAESAGVSYLPGTRFHSDGGGERFLRLAFSLLSPEEMREGAKRLGEAIKKMLET